MADYRKNFLARIDWITVVFYLVFIAFGWLNIYAATYREGQDLDLFGMVSRHSKQFVYILAALILAVVALIIDSKFWVFVAYPFYGFVILLLLLVLFLGREVNGATSWFFIGPISIQPAEFAKMGTVLILAKILSQFNFSIHQRKNMLLVFIVMLLPSVFILMQNDTGSALVYFALLLVLFREGMKETLLVFGVLAVVLFLMSLLIPIAVLFPVLLFLGLLLAAFRDSNSKILIYGLLIFAIVLGGLFLTVRFSELEWPLNRVIQFSVIGALLIYLIILLAKRMRSLRLIATLLVSCLLLVGSVDYLFNEVLEDHQRSRINQVIGVENDLLGRGYNLNQSKIAIGSGGFAGKGFLQGTQTRFDFVPEQSTDFIFCTVGEEWGFLGSFFVVMLFVGFLLRIIYLAERQRSAFSRIFGYGVFSIFFFHFMINIGMTIGVVPVIGIPLPFFSYGGSSLWSFTLLLFVFLHLDTDRFEVVA